MVEAMETQEDFKQTEVGVIPSNWEVRPIDEITSLMTNGFVGTVKTHYTDFDNGILYIQGYNIEENSFNFNGIKRVTHEFHKQHLKSCLQEGDLLTIQTGDIGVSTVVPKELEGANCHALIITRFKKETADPKFYSYYFNFSEGRKRLKEIETGSTMKHINVGDMIQMLIPYPSKAEQTAIATALNDADALITQLEKLIAKKRAIKQGAMQELLKPKGGWKVKTLGEIADIRRGASPRPIKDPKWFSDSGRGWIRISDVTSSNVYLNSTTQYLSEDGARNSVAVDRGDLIMSICATIGIPIIINIPACIHDGFVLFKNYKNELDTFFLYFFLQVKTEILTGKGQPGTQKNLNTTIVGNIEIDYPDVDEQRKIGLILRDIDIEISGLEKKLDKYKMIKQGMMQNLLTGRIRLI